MSNIRIAIIDSGISEKSECYNHIIESYVVDYTDNIYSMQKCKPVYYIGHGTAVAHILFNKNTEIDIICIRICETNMVINEDGLIFILKYIYDNLNVDIINISAGITYLNNYHEFEKICNNLYEKGIYIVSAFDNDGAISYPAAFDNVIGVDTKDEYDNKKDIYYVKNSIIDILVPNIFYRTVWLDKKTIIKGSSFACAYITGILSQYIKSSNPKIKKEVILKKISTKQISLKKTTEIKSPNLQIKKAIVLPINKESNALLRFKDMLNFTIAGVYDERLSGNIGKELFGFKIKSIDMIQWDDDFDTIILSCTSALSSITKHNYDDLIVTMAQKYNKKIYSFENLQSSYGGIFYPNISSAMMPYMNNFKLHRVNIPIVSVFGTSSKQGKFTLQLHLIKRLRELGYNVGHISTEPSGYLLGADYVFHFGYHANLNIQPWECISILNNMAWQVQLKNRDILVTGCQSGILHYNNSRIDDFAIYQYAFTLGIMPDFCILCINPHDAMDYISKTINFIDSIDEGKVKALVMFPQKAVDTISGIKYKTYELSTSEINTTKEYLFERFHIPVYTLGNAADMQELCNLVIDYFSAD